MRKTFVLAAMALLLAASLPLQAALPEVSWVRLNSLEIVLQEQGRYCHASEDCRCAPLAVETILRPVLAAGRAAAGAEHRAYALMLRSLRDTMRRLWRYSGAEWVCRGAMTCITLLPPRESSLPGRRV